jgi:CPA1 family monovalent cation:H+ antiporter
MLEGAVFLLMGLELKEIVRANIDDHQGLWHGAWLAATALCIILFVRAGYVTVLVASQGRRGRHRRTEPPDRQRRPRPGRLRTRVSRTLADLDYYHSTPLGWRHGTIIVWAGMRGVVTLAAAQTLPDSPIQALVVFVAFLVAVGGLMLQGFSLPWLVRLLKLEGSGRTGPTPEEQRRLDDEMRVAAASSITAGTLARRDGSAFPMDMLERVGTRMTQPPDDDTSAYAHDVLELRLALIGVMRERLNAVSREGVFSTAALRHALAELDADELSLRLRLDDDL